MGMAGMMGSMRSLLQDPSVVKRKVKPGTAKRMMRFAIPYARLLALFLLGRYAKRNGDFVLVVLMPHAAIFRPTAWNNWLRSSTTR